MLPGSHAVSFSLPQVCGLAFKRENSRGWGWRKQNPCSEIPTVASITAHSPAHDAFAFKYTAHRAVMPFVSASTPLLALPTHMLSLAPHPLFKMQNGGHWVLGPGNSTCYLHLPYLPKTCHLWCGGARGGEKAWRGGRFDSPIDIPFVRMIHLWNQKYFNPRMKWGTNIGLGCSLCKGMR